MKTPYEILGVPRQADDEEIRTAYRRAAKVHHPDLNAGDKVAEESFRHARAAYELIKNSEQRAAYEVEQRNRRREKARHFHMVLAGFVTGSVTLVTVAMLSKAYEPSRPQLPRIATAKVTELQQIAASDYAFAGGTGSASGENSASQKTWETGTIAASADLPGNWPPRSELAVNSADASAARADSQTPITNEWKQAQASGSAMTLWVYVVRNPEMFEDEPSRSELLQLIEAADDVRLLGALGMSADGAIAARAQQRLAHLAEVVVTQGGEVAGGRVREGDASASGDPDFYLARAMRQFRRGDFDQAIRDCDEAIRLQPGKAQAYADRAKAWAGKGDKERAQADYEAAMRIDPNNPALLREQGTVWRQLGDLERALAALDHAIRLGFSDGSAYNERGLVWLQKGRQERAIADFNQALKIDPELAAALINRGIAWRSKGALDRAIADFGQVISVDPALSAAYYNRALVRIEKQDIEPAMTDLAKAWELLPDAVPSAHVQ
jgi:tetratricopeptide (TPR) repeat protein